MSEKKERSKSKENDQPPKAAKKDKPDAKKDKPDAKSRKSVSKEPSEAKDKQPKSKEAKEKKTIKDNLDLSQDNFSEFLKGPFVPQQSSFNDEGLCMHHREATTIFCEICEQPGCDSCLRYGPHNNQMHRVSRIEDSFQARSLYLNGLVCQQLLEKREQLTKHLEGITQQSDELRYIKHGVEKDTKSQYSQVLQRLRTAAGAKFAVLHHEMAELQKDLQAINALGNEFFELTSQNPIHNAGDQQPTKGIVPFLLRCKYLQEQAEQLISKPIKTAVEVYPYDLPRELAEHKLALERNRHWLQLLRIKDEAVWQLSQYKKTLRERLLAQLNEQARSEIGEWLKLKQQILAELDPLVLRCSSCAAALSAETVNEECPQGEHHIFVK